MSNNDSNQVNIRDLIRAEYKKCYATPMYFMKKYVKIQHPDRGTILFDLYPFQEETLQSFIDNDKNIVLKSRQMGISTLVSAYALWLMLFNTDKSVVVISRTQDATKEIVTKIRFMNDNLPSWLKIPLTEDNRLSLRFKNGSNIKAVSSAAGSARGFACSLIILDEAAFIPNAEEVWVGANATTSTGGKAIILSTPNGVGDFFHKMWVEAEAKQNGFATKSLPWYLHPERDQKWRDTKGAEQGDKRKAAQEFDCDFTTTGNTVVDPDLLKVYRALIKEPIEKRWAENSLWIWEYPDYAQGNYMVSADVSRGDGSDKSAFHVIDLVKCEQVAEFKGIVDTKSYGNLLVSIANEYNKAILVVENNNIGWATLQQIIDLGYPNTFYSNADLMYVDVEQQMVGAINRMEKKMLPGFTLTAKNRPLVVSKMELYFRENSIKLNSIRTWEELSVFIWSSVGKAEAMKGYNDDLVMSLAMGLWVRDTAIRLKGETSEFNKALVNGISRPVIDTKVYLSRDEIAKKSWYMPVIGNNRYGSVMGGNVEDLKWLLR